MEDNLNERVQTSDRSNFNTKFHSSHFSYVNTNHNCQYYNEEDCYEKFKNISHNSFTILSINIRSLANKWHEFKQFITSSFGNYKPSVICFQEIWNISTFDNYSLEDYHPLFYMTRDPNGLNNNCGGGIGILVHNSLEFEPLHELSVFLPKVFESQFIRIKNNKNNFTIIGNVYRPNTAPFADLKRANYELNEILEKIKSYPIYKKCFDINLVGDFNIDLLKSKSHTDTSSYLDSLLEHGLLPIVSLPTRVSQNSATIIDHISTSFTDDNYDVGLIVSDLSDHFPVFYTRQAAVDKSTPSKVKVRQMTEKNKQTFSKLLQDHNWDNVLFNSDPNSAFSDFFNHIDRYYDMAFPEKPVKLSKRNKPNSPWITTGLLESRKHKQKLFSKKLRNPNPENTEKYKTYNSSYTKLMRKARQLYYKNKFESFSKDCKKTWETINELLGRKKSFSDIPDTFISNGKILSGAVEIAEGFNDFFVNIGPSLSRSIPSSVKCYSEYLMNPSSENFVFANTTPFIINEALKKLKSKNSSGHDKISTSLLKYITPTIMTPLCHLFNLSFKTGFIPNNLKTAMIKPIFKKGERDNFTNYRPISLLSSFSKLLEKIAANQMMKYINKYRLLYEHQYGFRAGYNTTQPIQHLLDKIFNTLNNEENYYTLAIFIDLTKAFDTCDIDILLSKLDHYGFRGMANNWFKSYLSNRKQFTSIRGVHSSLRELSCGVPQGSILGPLLFILLINDLPNATNFFNILYADDTTLLKSSNNLANLYNEANAELEKLADWFKANKLTLNISKTKYILFRKKSLNIDFSQLKLLIEGKEIDRIGLGCKEESFKFVGVLLDEFLTWDHHAKYVGGKAANAVYALSKVKNCAPINAKLIIYNSLFKSFIEYGICAWGRSKSKNIDRIISLQKRAIRCIFNVKYNAHTDPIFLKLRVLKFNDLLNLNQSYFVHSFIYDKLPPSFNNFFSKLPSFDRNLSLCTTLLRNSQLKLLPSYTLPLLWNSLPLSTKRISSASKFKRTYAEKLLSSYSSTCSKTKCYSCLN